MHQEEEPGLNGRHNTDKPGKKPAPRNGSFEMLKLTGGIKAERKENEQIYLHTSTE